MQELRVSVVLRVMNGVGAFMLRLWNRSPEMRMNSALCSMAYTRAPAVRLAGARRDLRTAPHIYDFINILYDLHSGIRKLRKNYRPMTFCSYND